MAVGFPEFVENPENRCPVILLRDIKPQNILVNDRALPSIIDTDSFQVRNPKNNKVYRCSVGSDGFTPPELIGKDFDSIDQTEVHDRFRLAVIIYQLLFGGESPFAGKWIGAGETPETNDRIRHSLWLYAPNSLIQPVERTIPLEIVHPEVQRCFLRCFNDGYKNSNLRPTAGDWVKALRLAVNELTICGKLDSHYYSRTYGKCYWCDRSTKLGVDIFPGVVKANSSIVVESTSQPQAFAADKIIEIVLQQTQRITVIGRVISTLISKQSLFQNAVSSSTSLSGNSFCAKTLISNTTANNTLQQLSAKNQIKNYAQVIIISLLALLTLGSLINFAINSLYSISNNSNSVKDERQELTQSELRQIANSKIEKDIIGIGISFKLDEKTKIPAVTNVFEKSPAASGNLKVGDQILEVNGRSTSKMSAVDVANLIQGDVNTAVFLLMRRPGFKDTNTMLIRESFINPNVDKDYVNRCSAHFNLKDYSEALDDCNEAIKINPNNDEAYCLRGSSHYLNGNKYQGMEDFRKSASLGNEKAREILKDVK